ncbi:MAG: YcnI family protein [Sporichthyaceae bacterium]
MSSRLARASAALATAALALGVLAAPAVAHVTVNPKTAEQGGYATLTFKVPNERDDASTTKLEVEFPAEYPLSSVSTQPKTGWTVTVEKAPLATPVTGEGEEEITERVAKITWTAAGGAEIAPGTFETFPISAGPLPTTTESMVFKALQTYSGGEIVRWIEEVAPGSTEEPDFPAPTLKLAPAGAPAPEVAAATAAVEEAKAAAEEAKATALAAQTTASAEDGPTTNQVNTAIGLAIGALVLALVAGGLGGMALARRGGNTGPPPAF